MSGNNRISIVNPQDAVATTIVDQMSSRPDLGSSRIYYLGQVVEGGEDPNNANRLRVRIPLLDDPFYLNDKGELTETDGHDKLPWCLPANSRFIDTPENGSIVVVGLFDPTQPFFGRIYFNSIAEVSSSEIFDPKNLKAEKTTEIFQNAEENLNIHYQNSPGVNSNPTLKNKSKKTNYKTGIKGKNKNKLLFDENTTTLVQNEGVRNKESKIEMSKDIKVNFQTMDLLSDKSSQNFHPVFDTPLYNFMNQQLQLMNQIITLLNTVPAIGNYGLPCSAAPTASALQAQYQTLSQAFQKLKRPGEGASKYLKIN